MINRKKWVSALTATGFSIGLLVSGLATAEKPGGEGAGHHGKMRHKMMAKMDTDGDKRISRDEFMAFHTSKFDKMDRNSDNFVDADERKAHHQEMKKKFKDAFQGRQQQDQNAE